MEHDMAQISLWTLDKPSPALTRPEPSRKKERKDRKRPGLV